MYDQGEPIKDSCSATCPSSSHALKYLWHDRLILVPVHIYGDKYTHPCKDVSYISGLSLLYLPLVPCFVVRDLYGRAYAMFILEMHRVGISRL